MAFVPLREQGQKLPVLHERIGAKRYQNVECLDCEELDSYGGEQIAELARQHARESGHHVVMLVQYRVDLNPPPTQPERGGERA